MTDETYESTLRLCRWYAAKQNCFIVAKPDAILCYRKMGEINTLVMKRSSPNAMLAFLTKTDRKLK